MPKIVKLQESNRPRTTIGQMRQEIKIITYADSPFGEYSLERNYTDVATIRARVTNISGSAFRGGMAIDANITHMIVIRKPEFALDADSMIEWVHPGTNEHLRVRQVRPVGRTSTDPRQQFVMILCESQGLVGAFQNPSPETIPATIEVTGLTGSDAVDNGTYTNVGKVNGKTRWTFGTISVREIVWGGTAWQLNGNEYGADHPTGTGDLPPKTDWPVGVGGTAPVLVY